MHIHPLEQKVKCVQIVQWKDLVIEEWMAKAAEVEKSAMKAVIDLVEKSHIVELKELFRHRIIDESLIYPYIIHHVSQIRCENTYIFLCCEI